MLVPTVNTSALDASTASTQEAEAPAIASRKLTKSNVVPKGPQSTAEAQHRESFPSSRGVSGELMRLPDPPQPYKPTRNTDIRWLTPPPNYKGATPSSLAVALANCSGLRKLLLGDEVVGTDDLGPFMRYLPTNEEQLQIRTDIIQEGKEAERKEKEARLQAMSEEDRKKQKLSKKAKRKNQKRAAARKAKKAQTQSKPISDEVRKHLELDDSMIDRIHEILVESREIDRHINRIVEQMGQPPKNVPIGAELGLYAIQMKYTRRLSSCVAARKAEIGLLGDLFSVEECRKRRKEAGFFEEDGSWNEKLSSIDMVLQIQKMLPVEATNVQLEHHAYIKEQREKVALELSITQRERKILETEREILDGERKILAIERDNMRQAGKGKEKEPANESDAAENSGAEAMLEQEEREQTLEQIAEEWMRVFDEQKASQALQSSETARVEEALKMKNKIDAMKEEINKQKALKEEAKKQQLVLEEGVKKLDALGNALDKFKASAGKVKNLFKNL